MENANEDFVVEPARDAEPTREDIDKVVKALSSESAAASTTDSRKRLMRDLKRVQSDSPEGIVAFPLNDDLFHWGATIAGPEDTPWEGGLFRLALDFTHEYPMLPPNVRFVTPVFHPNVYKDGRICMDIMKSQWSPAYDVISLLLSIQSLLGDPNPMSAANGEAAELYSKQREAYEARVLQLTEQSLELAAAEEDDE